MSSASYSAERSSSGTSQLLAAQIGASYMPMVMMSKDPPFAAMSVVTRWRRTFSSNVTHSTLWPVFAVKSSVRPCMRIISPLFTVAMVRAVAWLAALTAPAARSVKAEAAQIDFLRFIEGLPFLI